MTYWSHPRIHNPEVAGGRWHEISHEATAAFIRRKDSYPILVDKGKMDRDAAAADILAWQNIADDWDWICCGLGAPAGPDTLASRIAALDTAIERFFTLIDRQNKPISLHQSEQFAYIAAMRCWAEHERTQPATSHPRFFASIGQKFRAEAAQAASFAETAKERKAA